MKTDLKTNSCHNGSTEVWTSPPLSPTIPYCYDNKENSATLYNLSESTSNNKIYKQKNDFTRNEKIYMDHHSKMPENGKNGLKKPTKKSLELIPIKKTETTNNSNNKSSTRPAVENSIAVTKKNSTFGNISNNMTAIKKIQHRPVNNNTNNNNNNNRRQQNGESRLFYQLLQRNIEEAVHQFSWDSGYVHEHYNTNLPCMATHMNQNGCPHPGYRRFAPTFGYFSDQANYMPPNNTFNPHHRGSHPFNNEHPRFHVGSESPARKIYPPVPSRRVTRYWTRSITVWINRQTLFERTHWFKKPNIFELTPEVNVPTGTPSAMTLDNPSPSALENTHRKQSCAHEETPQTTTGPDLLFPVATPTPGDPMMLELPQDKNEDYDRLKKAGLVDEDISSSSDMEIIVPSSCKDDDDAMDGGRNFHLLRRCYPPSSSRKYIRSIEIDSDSDSESESDSDGLEVDGPAAREDAQDDLETDGHTSWLIRPDSDSDCNYDDDDDDDDWDTWWSSSRSAANPEVHDEIKDFVPEFTRCTLKISCAKEKADICAVDKVEGCNFKKLGEANKRWNKVYGDEDFTFEEENHSKKVQFASGKNFSSVHLLICWNYAYRAARKGPWIELHIDSERFQNRISRLKTTIDPILDPIHRHNIFTSRFQQAADKIA